MPRIPEFIRSFLSKARDGIGEFFHWLREETSDLMSTLKEKLNYFITLIPLDRRIVISVMAGIPVVLLVIIGVSLSSTGASADTSAKSEARPPDNAMSRRIPAEDLFIPEEPDFVPGVILEREKREQWSVDDAMAWWQDPLRDGEQEWRDEIEKNVDDIMEKTP